MLQNGKAPEPKCDTAVIIFSRTRQMLLPAEEKPQGERDNTRFKKLYNIPNSGCGLVRIVKEASAEEPLARFFPDFAL
jgi:hypothetical protein